MDKWLDFAWGVLNPLKLIDSFQAWLETPKIPEEEVFSEGFEGFKPGNFDQNVTHLWDDEENVTLWNG